MHGLQIGWKLDHIRMGASDESYLVLHRFGPVRILHTGYHYQLVRDQCRFLDFDIDILYL